MFEFFNTLLSIFWCTDSISCLLFKKVIACFTLVFSCIVSLVRACTGIYSGSFWIPRQFEFLPFNFIPREHGNVYFVPKIKLANYFYGKPNYFILDLILPSGKIHPHTFYYANYKPLDLPTIPLDVCISYMLELRDITDIADSQLWEITDRLTGLTSSLPREPINFKCPECLTPRSFNATCKRNALFHAEHYTQQQRSFRDPI
jgi:hypothetical protein